MDTFTGLKVIHILSVIVALGSNVTYSFWLRYAGHDRGLLLYSIAGVRRLDRMLANPAYIVVLLTGLGMVGTGQFTFGSARWLDLGLALYIVVAVLGIAVFAPAIRRQLAAAEADPSGPAYASAARRTSILGGLTIVVVAFIAYLMIVKPF